MIFHGCKIKWSIQFGLLINAKFFNQWLEDKLTVEVYANYGR